MEMHFKCLIQLYHCGKYTANEMHLKGLIQLYDCGKYTANGNAF